MQDSFIAKLREIPFAKKKKKMYIVLYIKCEIMWDAIKLFIFPANCILRDIIFIRGGKVENFITHQR